jgi:hypothetical protein
MSFKFSKSDNISDLHPNISKFFPKFVNNRVEEYELFKVAVESGDMSSVRLYCHKVVGIAASYNCFKLEEISLYVQNCAKSDDMESIKTVLGVFDQYMTELSSHK